MAGWLVGLMMGLAIALGVVGLFWPGWGLVPRWRRASDATARARAEDTLKHLYESEVNGGMPSMQSVAGAVRLSVDEAADVLQGLQRRRLIEMERDGIRLTDVRARAGAARPACASAVGELSGGSDGIPGARVARSSP